MGFDEGLWSGPPCWVVLGAQRFSASVVGVSAEKKVRSSGSFSSGLVKAAIFIQLALSWL